MAGKEALAAFTPLGTDFKARMVRAAREELSGAPPAPRRPDRPPRVRPRRWWIPAAAALAAAALLVVVWPEAERSPLPRYRIELHGAVRPDRAPAPGGPGERPWTEASPFAPGNRFELVLRPEQRVEGRLEARTYRQESGTLVPWPLPVEGPHEGAVRIAGTVGRAIDLPPGETILVVVVGRRGELPAAGEVLARLGEGGRVLTRDWLAWRQAIALTAAGEP